MTSLALWGIMFRMCAFGFTRRRPANFEISRKWPAPPTAGSIKSTLEAIADLAHGLQKLRMAWIFLDFRPQGSDTSIHASVVHKNLATPNRVQNLIPRHGSAGPLYEKLEQPEFLRRQNDFFPIQQKLAANQIKYETSETEACRGLTLAPSEEG